MAPIPVAAWGIRAPTGHFDFGSLRRLTPISRRWGKDRGELPIDRYIERFLAPHASDIPGRVLEVGDDAEVRSRAIRAAR